jgi:hypothetical protein
LKKEKTTLPALKPTGTETLKKRQTGEIPPEPTTQENKSTLAKWVKEQDLEKNGLVYVCGAECSALLPRVR